MNAQEADVPKSLLLVLPAAVLVSALSLAAEPIHHPTMISSGRFVSRDARETWFRQAVGDLLEGRVAPTERDAIH